MGPRPTQFRQMTPHVSSSTHPQNIGKPVVKCKNEVVFVEFEVDGILCILMLITIF